MTNVHVGRNFAIAHLNMLRLHRTRFSEKMT